MQDPRQPPDADTPVHEAKIEDRFQAIVTEADEGIIVLEPRAIIGYVNPAAEYLLGRGQAELAGEIFGLPLAPCEDPIAINVVARDGTVRLVEMRIEQLSQAARDVLVIRLRDVTDYDRRVADARDQVRKRDEFLAMLSHELRNPLAAIQGAVYVLSEDDLGTQLRREAQSIVLRQFAHLTRMLDDLLDISRITRGKVDIKAEPIELIEVVEDAIEAATPLIMKRGHALHIHLPPRPLWVCGDATRLGQIVTNLLNNAAKFTPEKGNVMLTLKAEGKDLELCVQDDGPGVPDDLRPHIFESFVQGGQTLARTEGGLGIGLALVQKFVELHGGSVGVTSGTGGVGALFTVRFKSLCIDNPHANSPQAPAAQRALRVLVIEDNDDARRPLAYLLEAEGHVVLEAKDGPSGLERLLHEHPDIAFVDIGLPGMDGYEVARRFRQQHGNRAPRMYALTGYGRPEDEDAARQAGFDGHMVKPVCLQTLRERLIACRQEREGRTKEGRADDSA